jgi:Tetratricopeptide repeat
MYINLARVHFGAGQRKAAVDVLRKGLRVDPDDRTLRRELQRMNPRATPTFDFLARSHPLNRYVGLTRARLTRFLAREHALMMC